ncbi:hypothetical protein GC093_13840 [Paenibacillus sp. LMG 31456]|uniref:Uncharacterized protein n=1 Tax=Paenibacillus foliorum TaxID=2654974 RepID=A0A972GUZ0_9BACL|nr:hypothetical protein [Paenibacillus foliorum]NOU94292.1 hypothetical protein [Paenibacillus foliorum]
MNPKRILMISTMTLSITIIGGLWNEEARAKASHGQPENFEAQSVQVAAKDEFLQVLGASSDEDVYNSLLEGKSLADIADKNNEDVKHIINLQIAELTKQLDSRFANGSISPTEYQLQKQEFADIIKKSVFGEANTYPTV